MSLNAMLHLLAVGSVAATAGTALVLAVRLPLRRLFGARLAYAGWALLPLLIVAAALPAPSWTRAVVQHVAQPRPVSTAIADTPRPRLPPQTAAAASGTHFDGSPLIVAAWASGALLLALHTARRQRRFVASLGPLRDRGDGSFDAPGARGPMVIGALRPRIVLPDDIDMRYGPSQAALVIAHERCHVVRRDVPAQLAFALLRCLQWFNPLVHAAEARFRIDQELACDAAVLALHPDARRTYGDAMLNTQLAHSGLPVGCHWQHVTHLKERILMLKSPRHGVGRRRLGVVLLVCVGAVGTCSAWALQPVATGSAPAYLGALVRGNLANVDMRMDKQVEPIQISGAAMGASAPGPATRVFMNGVIPLTVTVGTGQRKLTFEAQVANTVADDPVVVWTLARDGVRIGQGELRLTGSPKTVVVGGVQQGTASSVTLTFDAPSGPSIVGAAEVALPNTGDGSFRLQSSVLIGDSRVAGSVDVALHVSATGSVTAVDIERESQLDVMPRQSIRDYFEAMVFRPRLQDGKAVPSLVRTTLHVAPTAEQLINPPAWFNAESVRTSSRGKQKMSPSGTPIGDTQ